MSDDWLYDGGDPPDPGDRALLDALSAHRYQGAPPEWPKRKPGRLFAAVGAVLLAAAAVFLAVRILAHPNGGWSYQVVEGADCGACRLEPGEVLVTDDSTRVRLEVGALGVLDVAPHSRLVIAETGPELHRVVLEQGRIDALIVAPAGAFVVSTPAGDVIDLGCAFALLVTEDGRGQVDVGSGAVEVRHAGRAVRVPAGARTTMRREGPPRTPRWQNAPDGLTSALDAFDGGTGPLAAVLGAAGPRDTLSLWNLTGDASEATRAAAFARLAELDPTVLPTDEEAVRRGDPVARELLWRDASANWR